LVARRRFSIESVLVILLSCLVFGAGVMAAPSQASAQESASFEDGERSYSSVVVQNRRYNPDHEFTAFLGLLPLDAFTKGVTLGGAYTLHFNELLAWEVVQFNYSFQFDTSLKADLEAFDIGNTPFEVLNYYASSNLVFKPVYWKGSLLNSGLIRGELYTVLGGAFGAFTRSNRGGVDAGGGVRLFTSELVSFRLDMRYYMFFNDTILEDFSFEDEIAINLGTSIAF
jgi:outer membrane beta-barrel protein